MVWPMIAAAAIGVIGGALQGKGAAKQSDKEIAASKELERIRGREERATSAYQMELADYYDQLNSQRRRTARASMYDKYSTLQKPEGFERKPLVTAKPVDKGVV